MKKHAVSVVVPMRNSQTTIVKTLESIIKQEYPIAEIVVVDNASTDTSVHLVKDFQQKHRVAPIRVIEVKANKGVGASYNTGIRMVKTEKVICMHSDSTLPTKYEISRLMSPFSADPSVVATYSSIVVPFTLWQTYPFWEQCLLSSSVGKEKPGLNGKFDCLDVSVFKKIGGYDTKRYGHNMMIGGEDGDLHVRLSKVGSVVKSAAKVTHVHTLDPSYSMRDWIINRKLLARSYGRFLRVQWKTLGMHELVFAVKPILSFLPIFIPGIGTLLLFAFAFASMKVMFTHPSSRTNWRIAFLPFITIFLVYYETFWMLESFLFLRGR